MIFREFYKILLDKERMYNFLLQNAQITVPVHCNQLMSLRKTTDIDGNRFYCRRCKKQSSLIKNSIFSGLSANISSVLEILFHLSYKKGLKEISMATGYSVEKIKTVFDYSIHKIHGEVIAQTETIGHQDVVEIDETCLCGKRKYNTGRINPQIWAMGGIERISRRFFINIVPNRAARTLIPIIQRNVRDGATIYTDCFRSYLSLNEIGYVHGTVNHSRNFVDPITGIHTNTVENLWKLVKRFKRMMFETRRDKIRETLSCFIWFSQNNEERFIHLIRLFLPPNNEP